MVKQAAIGSGASNAVICNHWAEGGAGATELADAVIAATKTPSNFKVLYDVNASIEEKINTIAKEMYGAGQVVLADKVRYLIFLLDAESMRPFVNMIIMDVGAKEN